MPNPRRDLLARSKEELVSEVMKLQEELKSTKSSIEAKDKYGLFWADKEEEFEKLAKDGLPVLEPKAHKKFPDVILGENEVDHVLIEGDNYHALSILNYTHKEKVDVIYIDPPYNTGSDGFRYKDKRESKDFPDGVPVPKDHPYRHSYWLSFMEKRLKLAKDLLKDTGVIFISIDDNEAAQLRLLCDNIFGDDNLLDTFYLQVRYANKSLNEKDNFQKLIEQVLIYGKNKYLFSPKKPIKEYDTSVFKYKITEKSTGEEIKLGNKKVLIFKPGEYEITEEKSNIDFLKGTWASGSVLKGNTSGKFFHKYLENRKDIDGIGVLYKVFDIGEDGLGYRYFTGPKKMTATKGLFYSGIPLSRRREIETRGESQKEMPIVNFYDFSADFGNIRHEGGVDFRSGKKPTRLLRTLIDIHKEKDITILDFFAGSGTTAHAVAQLNKEDGGERQCILVTNNENKICEEVTYERVKRVMKGYKNTKGEKIEGLGGNLHYLKTAFVPKHSDNEEERKKKAKDTTKLDLTYKAGCMLALKESTFEEIERTDYWQIFQGKGKITAVYFREHKDKIDELLDKLDGYDVPVKLYIFSWQRGEYRGAYVEYENITCEDIPEPILEVYKHIGL